MVKVPLLPTVKLPMSALCSICIPFLRFSINFFLLHFQNVCLYATFFFIQVIHSITKQPSKPAQFLSYLQACRTKMLDALLLFMAGFLRGSTKPGPLPPDHLSILWLGTLSIGLDASWKQWIHWSPFGFFIHSAFVALILFVPICPPGWKLFPFKLWILTIPGFLSLHNVCSFLSSPMISWINQLLWFCPFYTCCTSGQSYPLFCITQTSDIKDILYMNL